MKNVLYAPKMNLTLISISKITDAGLLVTFFHNSCTISNSSGKILGVIPKRNGLYYVSGPNSPPSGDQIRSESALFASTEQVSLFDLHRRLGHLAQSSVKKMLAKGHLSGFTLDPTSDSDQFCEICASSKASIAPIPTKRSSPEATKFGDVIHTDLWGPAPVRTYDGKSYYISFTDEATRDTFIYLLRSKSDALSIYKKFCAYLLTQHGIRVKTLQSDRGGEYLSADFTKFLELEGTTRRLTVHDTPSQNGIAERLNRTLIERVRAILNDSGLPHFLWGVALSHINWLKRRTLTRVRDGATPYELSTGLKPDLRFVPVWGSKVIVHSDSGSKLDSRGLSGRWVGFSMMSKGHKIYWPTRRTVSVERNVTMVPTKVVEFRSRFQGEYIPISFDEMQCSESSSTPSTPLNISTHSSPLSPPTPLPSTSSETIHSDLILSEVEAVAPFIPSVTITEAPLPSV